MARPSNLYKIFYINLAFSQELYNLSAIQDEKTYIKWYVFAKLYKFSPLSKKVIDMPVDIKAWTIGKPSLRDTP